MNAADYIAQYNKLYHELLNSGKENFITPFNYALSNLPKQFSVTDHGNHHVSFHMIGQPYTARIKITPAGLIKSKKGQFIIDHTPDPDKPLERTEILSYYFDRLGNIFTVPDGSGTDFNGIFEQLLNDLFNSWKKENFPVYPQS